MPKTFSPDTGNTLSTGLQAYWTLDGNSNDQQNSNNGTDTSITYSSANGIVPQGAGFASASPSGIVIPDNAQLKPTTISVCCWYKNTDNPASNARYSLVYKDNVDASSDSYKFEIFNDAGTVNMIWDANNNNTAPLSFAQSSTGAWHFLVGTYDGDKMEVFLDGVSKASSTGGAAINYSTKSLYFGRADFTGRAYNGALDEIGIWNKVLSATEISDLYNGGNGNTYITRATISPRRMMMGIGS